MSAARRVRACWPSSRPQRSIGLDGRLIRVEVDVAPGLPGFTIVGLADAALQEARERVRGALRNAGFVHPPRRITVNLAPADLRKAGASLDLAMAIGILLGSEQVRPGPARLALIGELSLGGEVRSVPGRPADGRRAGAARAPRGSWSPAAAVDEARLVDGIEVVGVETLPTRSRSSGRDALAASRRPRRRGSRSSGGRAGRRRGCAGAAGAARRAAGPGPGEVRGQLEARRGLEIALAGGHGLLLIGPPGSGKTLLARTIPGLLPPLDDAAALAATVVASAAGEGPITELVRRPPFRAPHHTISYAAMVGGGPRLSPGEVTLRRPGRPVPRRAARVRARRARGAAPAARGGPGRDRARRAGDDVPGPVPARRGDEPVPVRVRRRQRSRLRAARRASRSATSGGSPARCATGSTCGSRCRASPPLALVGGPRAGGVRRSSAARIAAARTVARGRAHGDLLNGRLTGRALRAACGLDARPSGAPSSSPSWNGPAAAAPNGCCASRGRSRTSPATRRSSANAHLDEAAWFRLGRRAPRGRARPAEMLGVARPADRVAPTAVRAAATAAAPARPSRAERDAWAVLARRRRARAGRLRGACSRRYGSGRRDPREAALTRADRRGWRPRPRRSSGRPRAATSRLGPAVADRDRRGRRRRRRDARSGSARSACGRHRRRPGVSRSASRRSRCRRTSCSCWATRRRSTREPRSRSSGRAGRPTRDERLAARIGARPGGGRGHGRLGPRASGSTARPTPRRSTPAARPSRSSAAATRGSIPRAHARLARRDRRRRWRGRLGARPRTSSRRTGTFPRRNRVISGLADATVVVEAPARSGALDHGVVGARAGSRLLSSCPGRIDDPASAGCLAFLREFRDGTRIVAGIPQLIDDLGLATTRPSPACDGPGGGDPGRVGDAAGRLGRELVAGRTTVDELVAVTGWPVATRARRADAPRATRPRGRRPRPVPAGRARSPLRPDDPTTALAGTCPARGDPGRA